MRTEEQRGAVRLRPAEERDLLALVAMSADWAAEGNVYGYRANSAEEFRAQRCWVLEREGEPVGYCCGDFEAAERSNSFMEAGTRKFELEELYIRPALRSRGLGAEALRQLEPLLRAEGAAFLLLNAVSRDARRLLDFYEERAGMTCWSARMIKKL